MKHICNQVSALNCGASHPWHEDSWFVPVQYRFGFKINTSKSNDKRSNATDRNRMVWMLTNQVSSHSLSTIQCAGTSKQGWQWLCLTQLIMLGTWQMFLKSTPWAARQKPPSYFKWLMLRPESFPGSALNVSLILFHDYETNVINCLPSSLLALFRLSAAFGGWR